MKIFLGFIAVMLLSAVGSAAWADTPLHELRIGDYSTDAGACNAAATQLAQRLGQVSGVTVARSYCVPTWQGYPDQSIVVAYHSGRELATTLAEDDAEGGYDSVPECAADLARQNVRFKAATGLEPILSFCSPFARRTIVALGSATKKPQSFHALLGGLMGLFGANPQVDDPAGIAAAIEIAARTRGLDVAHVEMKGSSVRTAELFLYYYAERPDWSYGFAAMPTYPSMEWCRYQQNEALAIFKKTDVEPLIQFCVREDGGGDVTTLYTFGYQPNRGEGPLSDHVLAVPASLAEPQKYERLDLCLADRANVEREQQAAADRRIVGSLCTLPQEGRPVMMGEPWYYRTLVFFEGR